MPYTLGSIKRERGLLQTRPVAAVPFIVAFAAAIVVAPSHQATIAAFGAVGLAVAWVATSRWGVDPTAGQEMIGVLLASVGIIAMPVAFQAPIPSLTWPAIGLGILAIEAVWAAKRYPILRQPPPERLVARVGTGAGLGLAGAFVLALIAAVPLGLGYLAPGSRAEVGRIAPFVFGGYALGGVVAGALVGALRPFSRSPVGTMLLGIIGGICVYGAMLPAVALSESAKGLAEPVPLILIGVACGLVVGPPAALALRYDGDAASLVDSDSTSNAA